MALTFTHQTTHAVDGRVLSTDHRPSATLASLAGLKRYPQLLVEDSERVILDLPLMLARERQLDLSQSVSAFLAERLTDSFTLNRYRTTRIPVIDLASGRYEHRVEAVNALAEGDLTIAYTATSTPEIRNDVHRRDSLPDLVVSSRGRSLANCLIAVNGVFHATRLYHDELFALDGHANMRNCRSFDKILLVDTGAVGGHQTLALTADLYANGKDEDPRRSVRLVLPESLDLTGKSVMVVIDGTLHAFDGSYQVVGPREIKLHTHAMDLIHDFLHNPTTNYSYDAAGRAKNPYEADDTDILPSPVDVESKIDRFLKTIKQFPRPSGSRSTVLVEYRSVPLYASEPTVREKITYALGQTNITDVAVRGEARMMIAALRFSAGYEAATEIDPVVPMPSLTSPQFVLNRVLAKHSFLIIVNQPDLYKQVTPLAPIQDPYSYQRFASDTPRGIALYNHHKALPYLILTAQDGQHTITIDHRDAEADLYKTSLNPVAATSPLYDALAPAHSHRVEMLELFAP